MRIYLQKFGIVVGVFIVVGVLHFSSSAQCGNYFKTNYSAVYKYNSASYISVVAIKLDDWTGDGKSDFWNFQRNQTTSLLEIVIYPSRPTGYWDWDNPIIYSMPVSNVGGEFKVVDFNSDGRMDLAFGTGSFQILRNAGNGSFTLSSVLNDSDGSLGSNATIGFADINDDDLIDWIYSIFIDGTAQIRYQLQNADGSFGSKTTILTGSAKYGNSFTSSRLGDFNGDGEIDIVYNTPVGNTIKNVLIKSLGDGNFEIGTPSETDLFVFRVPVIDFNNDGKDDLLSRNIIFYGKADGTFDRVQLPGGSASSYNMLAAKLNDDNNWDIVEVGSDYYATYIGDGTGGFTRTQYQQSLGTSPLTAYLQLKFEDFSGDGKADLYNVSESPYNIFKERLVSIRENICQSFGETKQVNFAGDANADVLMWNPNSGDWSSKNADWTNGNTTSATVFNWGLGSLGDVPAPGDFDGDGKTDYSVYRASTGYWYVFRSSDSSWLTFKFGLPGDIAVPNDYDGGGSTDIAVFRPSEGNWYMWSSETQQFQGLHFGATGDKPVPADYDGDGKTDVAVFRPSESNWYILNSSDSSFKAFRWGLAADIPVPADYDGDGRADITVYRDGFWYIFRSSTNSHIFAEWGLAGDIPVPVSHNGLSSDLGLYRPSDNTFRSFYHRNTGARITLGGNQDTPIYFGLPNN